MRDDLTRLRTDMSADKYPSSSPRLRVYSGRKRTASEQRVIRVCENDGLLLGLVKRRRGEGTRFCCRGRGTFAESATGAASPARHLPCWRAASPLLVDATLLSPCAYAPPRLVSSRLVDETHHPSGGRQGTLGRISKCT